MYIEEMKYGIGCGIYSEVKNKNLATWYKKVEENSTKPSSITLRFDTLEEVKKFIKLLDNFN